MHQMKNSLLTLCAIALISLQACGQGSKQKTMNDTQKPLPTTEVKVPNGRDVATFGAGCFWCVEAVFQDLAGVDTVLSGYSGGHIKNPPYREVTQGRTGHAEAVQIFFDPKVITYEELLEIFWVTHDPTTLNRQGADVGPQYRSAVFYHNDKQKNLAEQYKKALDQEGAFDKPIVTEITPFSNFYVAEDYHQNYFKLNGNQPYCQIVIQPKVDKVKKVFGDKLKKNL